MQLEQQEQRLPVLEMGVASGAARSFRRLSAGRGSIRSTIAASGDESESETRPYLSWSSLQSDILAIKLQSQCRAGAQLKKRGKPPT